MHREESRNDLGTIRIHDNVVASIASIAVCEIEGVKGIQKNLKSGIMELVDKKNASAVKVEKDRNGEITVGIPLIIKYGFSIPEVANKAQENVRNALEKMTNITIKDININIQAIERG